MGFKEYERKFRQRSTSSLIKGYSEFNEDFRRIARQEFKKRRVPQSKLPYTKPKRRAQFDFGFTHYGRKRKGENKWGLFQH